MIDLATEERIEKALDYLYSNPDVPLLTVATQIDIKRSSLRSRLAGHMPRKGFPARNTKLLRAEEKAIRVYVDRLDYINLAIYPKYLTATANAILAARAAPHQAPI